MRAARLPSTESCKGPRGALLDNGSQHTLLELELAVPARRHEVDVNVASTVTTCLVVLPPRPLSLRVIGQ